MIIYINYITRHFISYTRSVIIISCRNIFVRLIFVAVSVYENILTTKLSQITVTGALSLPVSPIEFTTRPENIVAAAGSEACFYCEYSDHFLLPPEWEKDGTTIRPGEPASSYLCHCVTSWGTQPTSLCFDSVSMADVGTYTCVQALGFATTTRCTVTLSLAGEECMCVYVCSCNNAYVYQHVNTVSQY